MDALSFVNYINQNNMNLQFAHQHDYFSVHFLDITLSGSTKLGIEILPYTKSMDRNTLLLATSCHAPHTVNNLPVGEFIRTKRNCSSAEKYSHHEQQVVARLGERRYPKWAIDKAMYRIRDIPRDNLLTKKVTSNPRKTTITFSATYSPQFSQITSIIKKHLPVLSGDSTVQKIISTGIHYVSTRAPTLGTILSPACSIHPNHKGIAG